MVTSKRKAPESRQKFREPLQMQRKCRFEKKQAAMNKRIEGEMAQVMANSTCGRNMILLGVASQQRRHLICFV
jgi:hypothetical protein